MQEPQTKPILPETGPVLSEPEATDTPPENEERLVELTRREEALKERERRFMARESLSSLSLPESLLPHLDTATDTGLERSLTLLRLVIGAQKEPPLAPKAVSPRPPAFATYLERARLFEEDPAAYALMKTREQPENKGD